MKNDLWYDYFLEALSEKYPRKAQLTEALMNLLSIEREAVYRRLRKDVVFPFNEIAKIANSWGISLDNIVGMNLDGSRPFQMKLMRYFNSSEEDMETMQHFIDSLARMKNIPESEFMEVSNIIPGSLFSGFPILSRFYTFKWLYQYGDEETAIPFNQVIPTEKMRQLELDHHNLIKNITTVHYIWDNMMINYLIEDIKYFSSVYLLNEEDVRMIKEDILSFLDYMETVAAKGYFPETGNKVNLYISQMNIDTGYGYFYTNTVKLSLVRTFILNVASSYDEKAFEKLKNWIHLKKRFSTQISGSGEKQRIDFFKKQRQLVESNL